MGIYSSDGIIHSNEKEHTIVMAACTDVVEFHRYDDHQTQPDTRAGKQVYGRQKPEEQ